jgi:hypothetical protein
VLGGASVATSEPGHTRFAVSLPCIAPAIE